MNTKKCSKCGWEYPIDWPGRRCRFCQEPFKNGPCSHCGKVANLHNGVCRSCETIQHREWRESRVNSADVKYKDWLNRISKLPYPFKTLTEEEWMEACKHFGGCAYCGTDSIDARSMFIQFNAGGRYCAWNIIPACEQCETALKVDPNPFLRMDDSYHRGAKHSARKYGFTIENLQNIVDYLQSRMEEVSDESM